MEKPCLYCKTIIVKPVNESVWAFENRRKFCSKVCMNLYRQGRPSCSPNTAFQKGHTIYSIVDTRKKRMGEENNMWNGGVTPINEKVRRSFEYKKWRKHVLNRDDFTCQACGQRGGKLHVDHELPFAIFKDLRLEILNGRTLCVPCHQKTPTYGRLALNYSI